ncbi:MAG: hypothetical protein KGS00_07195, partial [Alphaproteobacteria bacterium]|nr:hypothetical protein [Alphaproteobacteria bacterium]
FLSGLRRDRVGRSALELAARQRAGSLYDRVKSSEFHFVRLLGVGRCVRDELNSECGVRAGRVGVRHDQRWS